MGIHGTDAAIDTGLLPGTAKRFPLAPGSPPLETPWGHFTPVLGEGMNVGLYHTVAAMRTNQQRVEIISSNIANSESAGFKRMLHVAHGNAGWGREPSHEQIVTGTRVDLSQGVLERTGESPTSRSTARASSCWTVPTVRPSRATAPSS